MGISEREPMKIHEKDGSWLIYRGGEGKTEYVAQKPGTSLLSENKPGGTKKPRGLSQMRETGLRSSMGGKLFQREGVDRAATRGK